MSVTVVQEAAAGIPTGEVQTTIVKPRAGSVSAFTFSLAFAVIGIILVGLFLSILKINNGTFTYTLDDPYIHLALSDQIRHGNYGLNAGLHASPSSSILFPFLLAAAGGTPLHPYLPLIINSFALFFTIYIMKCLLLHLRLAEDNFGTVVLAAAIILMAFCFNVIGVVFTGLEHSLHIAAVSGIIYGLAVFLDEGEIRVWLPPLIVLAPLLRYEGLALSMGALLVLALRGRWRTAAGAFALIVFFLAGFSAFLMRMGLPPMPSSILVKSDVVSKGISGAGLGLFKSFAANVLSMYRHNIGILLLVIGVAAATRCLQELPNKPRRWTSQGLMSLVLLCLIAGHALAGRFGWLDRYEDYAVVGTALIGIYLMQDTIRRMLANKKDRLALVSGVALCLLIIGARYSKATMLVPIAANNIYEQQLQMHHFIADFYRAPVAVNDLGLASYHNSNFVLDLGGLASEQARILLSSRADAAAYSEFLSNNGVHLAIIYDEWFSGRIPKDWEKIGSMDLSRMDVSPADKEVQFYATDSTTAARVREELQTFQKTLPPRITLTIH